MAATFYTASAEILKACQAADGDLTAILDPENGFAPRLSKLCKQQLRNQAGDSTIDVDVIQEDADMLRLESNTWDLLQVLLPLRKLEPFSIPTARELIAMNPYTPTATLAQAIMKNSPLLNELVAVREWLHDNAPPPHLPEATTGYWRFTRHQLQQGLRMGNRKGIEGLVTELDPDAPNRADGKKSLAADDANYDKALAQALYAFVRAGKLEEAADLCRKAHRPWKAASIRGSLLFHWKALAGEQPDENAMQDSGYAEGWGGNKRRKLWKATCTRAALNPSLSEPDRALYAALAPSPATSVILKSACRTWEDHIWAQISIICEGKETDEISRIGGRLWDGVDMTEDLNTSTYGNTDDDIEWEQEAVQALESLANVSVQDGPPANDPFHISQLHIVLGRTDKLLNDFANGLQSGEFNPDQPNYSTLTRFFAHLCLFLQLVDIPVPPVATQVILEVYLLVLESAGQRDHIAMYASALGENAVERYALFLTGLGLTADLEERKAALRRAEDHGLDIIRVAKATAEKTIKNAFEQLPPLKLALPSVVTLEITLSDAEWLLIRSIEWTTFMEATYPEALQQANAIFRHFLGAGKVHAAKILLAMLPQQLRAEQGSREQSAEFAYYLQFFEIWEALDRVSESQAAEMSYTTKGVKSTWLNTFKPLVEDAREKILELLTTDWLGVSELLIEDDDQRRQALSRIRKIYIPELVIRLHALLIGTSSKIEGNLKKVMELVNIVADSRYRLYDDFVDDKSERLSKYLSAVQQAIMKGLEGGGVHPFRVLEL